MLVKMTGTQTSSSNLMRNPLSGYMSSQEGSSKASLHSHYGGQSSSPLDQLLELQKPLVDIHNLTNS